MTEFELNVYDAVKRIPSGHVASYKQIALMAGRPGAARAVGNIIHKNPWPDSIPCFRVVHTDGSLASGFAFGGIYEQRNRLVADGIDVVNFKVDMSVYQMK